MASERNYTTRRMGIVNALVEALKQIDGASPYQSDVEGNVSPRLLFWDEVGEFPSLHVSAGPETREYQGGGYKDRFMTTTIRCYVNEEEAVEALEGLLEDVETVLEAESQLTYKDRAETTQRIQQITILSIDTDEGVLEPLGVGEIVCTIRY